MKVHEVQCGEVTTLQVEPDGGGGFGCELAVRAEALLQSSDDTQRILLQVGAQAWALRGVERRDQQKLDWLAERNLPRLCWVAAAFPKGADSQRTLLQVHTFPARHLWPGTLDLGVDEKVVEHVRRKRSRVLSVDDVLAWLSEKLLLEPTADGQSRALVSGSASLEARELKAFRLLGAGFAVDVVRGKDDRLLVTRLVELSRPERQDERRPVLLVQGEWRFRDATTAHQVRGSARTQLDQLVAQASGYLHVWKEYNSLEREGTLRRARALGWLRYEKCQPLPDGRFRFHLQKEGLEEKLGLLQEMEQVELEAASSPPRELLSEVPSPETKEHRQEKRERVFAGSFVTSDLVRGTIDLRPPPELDEVPPPTRGVLFVGLSGHRTRLRRREDAWALIASAECRMPQLGLLLEDLPVPVRRSKTETPLSQAARALFGGEPTPRQIEALRVALNTPDIALIQGPPGTGKTRTIAALQARLAELEESEGVFGQTLLTSYQHYAVENAASKTLVLGLPALKLGRRRGQTEDVDGFDRWRRERVGSVRAELATLPGRPLTDVLRQVRHLTVAYVSAPGHEGDTATVLRKVSDLARDHLPPELRDRLFGLQQQLEHGRVTSKSDDAEDRELALKAVRSLRTEEVPFSDDGPRNARRALNRLEAIGVLEPEARALLERASGWDVETPPPFLAELRELRGRLVDRLLPDDRPVGASSIHADAEALLVEVVGTLHRRVRESSAGPDAVLYDYLDDLENDAEGVREAVKDYTAVLAATCQQSVGRQMHLAKDAETPFHNVIIDEAARSNPLDLFIPMSRAERRIILVGDQRQLPHMLEPDVESQLEQSVSEQTRTALRRSLFERLFRAMKAREDSDGIKRTVTLDVQYRMNPVLGDFVSDTFYKPYNEGFRSGRPPEDFAHDLEGYRNAAAVWKDIPLSHGQERSGRSKSRPVEARWIAREVSRLAEQRRDFSFGVIAFYAAQVQELLREMEKLGLAERSDDGTLEIASSWKETRGGDGALKERLRVGTVDAFQGKEFDVVLLSMTRSNDLRADDERARRRKYGHLMLENRLCVAMSRQQRLLILVGDGGMLHDEAAESAIPSLIAFRRLCGGSHGLVLPA